MNPSARALFRILPTVTLEAFYRNFIPAAGFVFIFARSSTKIHGMLPQELRCESETPLEIRSD